MDVNLENLGDPLEEFGDEETPEETIPSEVPGAGGTPPEAPTADVEDDGPSALDTLQREYDKLLAIKDRQDDLIEKFATRPAQEVPAPAVEREVPPVPQEVDPATTYLETLVEKSPLVQEMRAEIAELRVTQRETRAERYNRVFFEGSRRMLAANPDLGDSRIIQMALIGAGTDVIMKHPEWNGAVPQDKIDTYWDEAGVIVKEHLKDSKLSLVSDAGAKEATEGSKPLQTIPAGANRPGKPAVVKESAEDVKAKLDELDRKTDFAQFPLPVVVDNRPGRGT